MADKTVPYRPYPGAEFRITGSEDDIGVLGHIERTEGRYEEDVTAFFRRFVRDDAVIIDGGANIGVLTVLAASLAPRGRVYAFEPAPANVEHLRTNIAQNNVTNVEVVPAALSAEPGELSFVFNEAYPAGSHLGDAGGGALTVEAIALDAWADDNAIERVDLIKIDVEGAEPAALAGARRLIERHQPILIVECNAGALRRVDGRSFAYLFDVMRAMYPTVAALSEQGRPFPLRSLADLELRLGHRGVVDLVGLPEPPAAIDRGLARFDEAVLRLRHNRLRPPRVNYVVTPIVTFAGPAAHAKPGERVDVSLTVANNSRWWLSSAYVYEPVRIAYRIVDDSGDTVVAEGARTEFTEPLGPGATVHLEAGVDAPDTPGKYQIAFTLVQEGWAWLDEIDPRCRGFVPLTVAND